MKALGYITATIGLIIYAVLLSGCVLTKLWLWFMVPTFGLPVLSLPGAIGLALVIGFLARPPVTAQKTEEPFSETLIRGWVEATMKPLAAVLLGAIVKLWL